MSALGCERRAYSIANCRKRHAADPDLDKDGRLAGLPWADEEDCNLIDLICMDWNKRWYRLKDNVNGAYGSGNLKAPADWCRCHASRSLCGPFASTCSS